MSGTRYPLEVNPLLPARLARLDELANDLRYSWDRPTRDLFAQLHNKLWRAVGHSPKALLKRIDQHLLDEAAENSEFLGSMARVLSAYDSYQVRPSREIGPRMAEGDLIAYFCAEFGFHESLPIYSGGLGILAGDHCKTASDMHLPFVGVGLLYRQGYFQQTIDGEGRQAATYHDSDFDELPVAPAVLDSGEALHIQVELPGRMVEVKVWQVRVGVVKLYLLDTDLEQNTPHDRDIAHRLYGGDRTTRIEQEIILGIGGVRALKVLGLHPTVWHINEGHAAFLVLERIRQLVRQGLDFDSAFEAAASNMVFTTHTPVPAGHDHFAEDMIRHYFESCANEIGCSIESLLALGRVQGQQEFNMTTLALRSSSYHNAVSRIHGEVSSRICKDIWPQIDPDDNPMDYVTNGIHVPSFLSELWRDIFDRAPAPGGWSQNLTDAGYWQGVHTIPDHQFWSTRQSIKAQMLHLVRARISEQHARNHGSQAHLDRLLKLADPDNPNVLTIGFARRFATYKRATLLFKNLDWLRQIVSDPERPVVFIFAGKAHPADEPGQAMIRRIAEVAAMPEFEAHILMVEGYDLHLSRRLVAGVDVWLNNPLYPLEASGTSGMKAAINGVINLSVLDGWWGEGYQGGDGANGWAIKPVSSSYDENRRDYEEARTFYELLQDKVSPLYYDRSPMGYSPGWVAMAKRSIATIAPHFNSMRMVSEYVTKFYQPAARRWSHCRESDYACARRLSEWKARIGAAWSGVTLRWAGENIQRRIRFGESIHIEVALQLNKLKPDDVRVELLLSRPNAVVRPQHCFKLARQGRNADGEDIYGLELTPDICGKIEYRIRVYPHHELLPHPFEMGMMVWL
ncbi:Glycogen phosphorylase [Georgfuchsia toluolica]|uniref:Glycogen phosphorylase n=1 Tax=Georgfuchsia toluolica TaxID=424218 RepID=A0A916J3X6_9PROT|nr:alpha-glucan family phosphorylase [Georgfuchsia toluolica]CAG4883533.1 Glycogen phosphorylase [Georgfuchsia toluolica]